MTRKRIAIIGGSLLAALVLLWALLGWLWLPAFVKREAPKALAATGHVLSIGTFEFNPFTLKAVATGIAIADAQGKPVFAVAQVVADLEWRSLARLAAVFSELSITRPELNVDIDPEGRVNLAALAGPDKPEQPPRGLPRVLIGRLAIEEGSIAFADRREGYSNRVEHLALDLGEVSTLEAEEGRLKLAAQTHDGAQLAWEGTLSLQPLAAAGTLDLKALALPSLMPYLDGVLAGRLVAGTGELRLPHRFEIAGGRPQLRIEKGTAGIAALGIELPGGAGGSAKPAIRLERLGIEGIDLDLQQQQVSVQSVQLDKPAVDILRRNDGSLDVAGLLRPRAEAAEGTAGKAAAGQPWAVGIKEVAIGAGHIGLQDEAMKLALALEEVNASLKGFALAGDAPMAFEAGAMLRDAAARAAGRLALKGEALPGFANVKARLGLESLALSLAQPVLDAQTRLRLASGTADLALDLLMSADKGLSLTGDAGLASLALADATAAAGAPPVLKLEKLGLNGLALDLAKRQLSAQQLLAGGLDTALRRGTDGQLDLQRLLVPAGGAREGGAAPAAKPAPADPKGKAGAATTEAAWAVRIARTELSGSSLAFSDETSGLALALEGIAIRVDDASSDLSRPIAFEVGAGLRGGGRLSARGRATPYTGGVTARVEASAIPLALAQPLLDARTRLRVVTGNAGLAGDVRVNALDATAKETFRYSGAVSIAELALEERQPAVGAATLAATAVPATQIMGWKLLATDSLRVNGLPLRVDMDELRLVAPRGRLAIAADRSLNMGRAFTPLEQPGKPAAATPKAAGSSAATPPAADAGGGFTFALRRLRVEQGELEFSDQSLTPGFATRIHDLAGTFNGLSTERDTRSQFSLEGGVDEFGYARLSGALNPFLPKEQTNFRVEFRNLDLTRVTPYAMKFAGYRIASGKLGLDLRYRIRDSKLEGENQAVFDQLELGEQVDSPDALKLPISLAIALLKDANGRIDLDIPVSGDLSDPQFSYGGLIWRAIGNVISKIVTAPFRALGALFGGRRDADEVKDIAFEPGQSRLLPPQREKLKQLSGALAKRPELKLVVPGHADSAADGERLKRTAVTREIARRAGFDVAEDESAGGISIDDRRTRTAIRAYYTERFGSAELDKARAEAEAKAAATEGGKPGVVDRVRNLATGEPQVADARPFYAALVRRLREAQPVPADALQALGRARSEAVIGALRESGTAPARLQAGPVNTTAGDARAREVKVELELAK